MIGYCLVLVLLIVFIAMWASMCYEAVVLKEISSKHPEWEPGCRRNFLLEDPQWYVDNGYEDLLKIYGIRKVK